MKFEEFPLRVPNVNSMKKKVAQFSEQLANAKSAKEVTAVMKKFNKYMDNIQSDCTVIQIRFSIDTTNKTYVKAVNKLNESLPLVSEAINAFNKALASSPYREELEKVWGHHLFEMIDNSLKAFKPEIVPDLIELNKLDMEYNMITGGAQIEFRGQIYNLSQMGKFKTSLDRETRKEAFAATDKWGEENAPKIEEIYDKMVKTRDSMAKKLGFKNFIELGYLNLGRCDYNAEMVANYRKQIYDEVVPLSNKLAKRQKARLGIKNMKYYDWVLSFLSGNPTPNGDEPVLVEAAQKMYDEMSKETGEFFSFMRENHLLDLTAKPGKQPGGYMTFMPKYKCPFIFANFNGTSGDVDTLTHEVGHAFQGYVTRNMKIGDYRSPGLEACEIHSMSMEFLTYPWMDLFFGKDTAKFKFAHLESAVMFLPYGVAVDEFQHWVYENPTATCEERNTKWLEIDNKYRPYYDWSDSPFYSKGRRWLLQGHIFGSPFYYIDYTLAQICAFQFFAESMKNREKAWKKYVKYCKLGGTYPFVSLLEHAKIKVPFNDGTVKKAIGPVKKVLNSIDDKAF